MMNMILLILIPVLLAALAGYTCICGGDDDG